MIDIVKKLRSPVDEKEDYFISQWPSEEPKTHDAVRFQAADEIERLRAALQVCDRVLHFDLRKMITWGNDYNQAVKDAADAARAALETREAGVSSEGNDG